MNQLNPTVIGMIRNEIIRCIKELLEEKHLYQSVRIDESGVQKMIDSPQESAEVKQEVEIIKSAGLLLSPGAGLPKPAHVRLYEFTERYRRKIRDTSEAILGGHWSFSTDAVNQIIEAHSEKIASGLTDFVLPTISVPCEKCDGTIQPHNSGFRWQPQEFQAVSFKINKDGKQVPFQTFVFPYHCQKCKEEPLIFLVHREGTKLTLAGRNHFEKVQVPKTIPKEESKYFSDAVVAYRTGNILAGLFLLRTTIEQYMRRILKTKGKTSGEDLADEYAALLDPAFPKKYSTMKVIFEELSVKLHSADADGTQFEKSKKDIEQHFEQLKLLPLKKNMQKQKR